MLGNYELTDIFMFCLLGNLCFLYTDLFVSDPYAYHSQSLCKAILQQQTKLNHCGCSEGQKKGKVGTQRNSDKAQTEPEVQEIIELAQKPD